MTMLLQSLRRVASGQALEAADAQAALTEMLDKRASEALISGFLASLCTRGERAGEILGFARGLRALAKNPGPVPRPCVDTCGTGGDGLGTFNISTAVGLLCAALGMNVVKHGNRSVSSLCGSADVIEALGIPFHRPNTSCDAPFRFLFAPDYHPAMKRVAALRRQLGLRTVFNLAGPLANPAAPEFQLVGISRRELVRDMALALRELGCRRAFVVWGEPGTDEATPAGPFVLADTADQALALRILSADDFGLPRCNPEALLGGDAAANAEVIRRVFHGERSARRDVIVLNAALVLMLTGRADQPRQAAALAARAIDDGAAARLLNALGGAP